MILPTKHTSFSDSLLGFGSYILSKLKNTKTIDELWREYQVDYNNKNYCSKQSFDNLLKTLVFLHSLGIIDEQNGSVVRCD